MKKILLTIAAFVVTLVAVAQSPNLMNYQGVARNAAGNVLPSQPIGLRLSILSGSPAGTVVYQETRNVTTNAFGLFNVVVGSPGAITTTGTIASVNWTAFGAGSGTKYLQVEIDATGGTAYFNVGSTQLVSVPYALNAGAAAPVGPAGGDLSGTYPNPTVVKLQGRPVAPTAPINKNLLMWDGTTSSWIPATAAQAGIVSGTGTLNYVPKWTPDGVTLGNSQIFDNGTNVGVGTNSPGARLHVDANAPASATEILRNADNTGYSSTWYRSSGGVTMGHFGYGNPGAGLWANQMFAGSIAAIPLVITTSDIERMRISATGEVGIGTTAPTGRLEVVNANTNSSVIINQTNAANASNGVLIDNANLTGTAFGNGSILARRGTVSGTTSMWAGAPSAIAGISSTGYAVQGASETSFGVAGTTVTGVGVRAYAVGTGAAVVSTAAGTGGISGDFAVTDATNISNTIRATNANATAGQTNSNNGGGNALFGRKGAGLGTSITNPAGVYGSSSAANGIGVIGLTLTNIGTFGGAITTGVGVYGQTFGAGGTALYGNGASSPTSYGLVTQGLVQIQGNGAGANKVLTSDATGNATWATLGASGGVSGSGTLNYVPKFTPNGTTIGNSRITENGSYFGFNSAVNRDFGGENGISLEATGNTRSGVSLYNNFNGNTVLGSVDARDGAFKGLQLITWSNHAIGFFTNNTWRGMWGSNGNFGINTPIATDPTAKLEVIGNVKITDGTQGAGKILTSDAAGNASWQSASVGISLRNLAGTVSIPTGVSTPITQWNNILYENGGANYNNVNGEYNISTTGIYTVHAALLFDPFSASGSGFNSIRVFVNGFFEYEEFFMPATGGYVSAALNYTRNFTAGEKISIQVQQTTGVTQYIQGNYNGSAFSVTKNN